VYETLDLFNSEMIVSDFQTRPAIKSPYAFMLHTLQSVHVSFLLRPLPAEDDGREFDINETQVFLD